jgi:hypothetical protein
VNGIDGFLGKPSIVLDARVMSTGARPGDAAGTQADSKRAAAFGGHLADLSRQGGKASDKADLGSLPNRAVPVLVQQSFLLATGTAEAAKHGASEPETEVPDARSTIASPQASSKTPNGANFAERIGIGPGGTPAAAPDPVAADASPGVRRDSRAERPLALGVNASFADGGSVPTGHRPVIDAPRDSHARSIPGDAAAFTPPPLVPGFPLLFAFPAAGQAAVDGSNGTAASADGAAALEIGKPHAGLAADPNGDHGPDFAASAPVGVSVVNQQTHFAPPIRFSPALQIARSIRVSASAPATVDTNGLASSGEPALLAVESAPDSADAQEIVEPHASHSTDPNSGHGPEFTASASVRGLVVNQQTHTAPPNRLSPAQQIAELVANRAGPNNLDASPVTAQSSRAPDAAGMADSRLSMSRVQTMQLKLDPEILGKVTVSMRLSGTQLDIRVATERADTMQLIGKDRDLLTGKLQTAGYAIETLVIQMADPQAPQQQFGVNVPSNGQDPSTGQANGGPSAHDRPSTHDDRQRSRPLPADDAQDGAGVRLTDGDLYL